MSTRRLLLASQPMRGGIPKIDFPVTLVLGDNGQVGIDLYNYLIAVMPKDTYISCPNDEYGIGEIIIKGWGNADELRIMELPTTLNIFISNSEMRRESVTPTLRSNGYFS